MYSISMPLLDSRTVKYGIEPEPIWMYFIQTYASWIMKREKECQIAQNEIKNKFYNLLQKTN